MGTSQGQMEQLDPLDSSQSVVIRIDPESTSEDVALFVQAIDDLHGPTDPVGDDDDDEKKDDAMPSPPAAEEDHTTSEREDALVRLKFVDTLEQKVAEALERARHHGHRPMAVAEDSEPLSGESTGSSFWCSSSSPTHSAVGSHSSHDGWATDSTRCGTSSTSKYSSSRSGSTTTPGGVFSTLMASHLEAMLHEATGLPEPPSRNGRSLPHDYLMSIHDEADRDVEAQPSLPEPSPPIRYD